jgi:ERCC4-type nuclease
MIFVDDREPEHVCEILRSIDVEFQRKRLEVGDYLIRHGSFEISVERKDIRDYVSSIINGRLFNQLYNLSANFEKSFIFIIGDFGLVDKRIDRRAFIGSLISIALKEAGGTIHAIQLGNDEEFCLALRYLNNQLESGKLKAIPRAKRGSDATAMLMAIPGIGEEKARRLLEKFGNIHRIVNASMAELMKTEGIGKKQARRIYNFVRGRKIR